MNALDISNRINLGILAVTALVGILAWLGARKAAREAGRQQDKANAAAERSASAAEQANDVHSEILRIEQERHEETKLQSKRAILRAEIVTKEVPRYGRSDTIDKELYFVIKNSGAAAAHKVGIMINDKPFNDFKEFERKFPDDVVIGAGADYRIGFSLTMKSELLSRFCIALSWSDDLVEDSWQTTLSL